MRDNVLKRAIIISIAVHLAAVCFVGRTSNSRLNAASIAPLPQRLLDVALVRDPLSEPKPTPVVTPTRTPDGHIADPRIAQVPNPAPSSGAARPSSYTPPAPGRTASSPGGALNTGTPSRNGDVGMGNSAGRTPVGWVPGGDNGRGIGSGNAAGVGTPEPPRADPPRHIDPPAPAPPPKRVTVRICEASGQLAGEHCKSTRNESFNDGEEPRRTCDRCKAPEPAPKSRLADRRNPEIAHDVHPRIPDSVDEGLTLEVEIEYWVDTDGSVSGVRVTKSSGNRDMDRAVTSAASQWRYNPAVQDGVARRVQFSRVIRVKT